VDAAVGATGEVPEQPAVGVAEDGVAGLGRFPHAVDVLEDPLDLAAGEVRRRRKTGPATNRLAVTVALQARGDAVGARVLPHDGVVVRPPCTPVPHHGGLALVGDAQRSEIGRRQPGRAHRRSDDLVGALPDLGRIVLHPAGLGHELLVLELGARDLAPEWSKIMKRVLVVP
jgi:hypothetical protein